MIFKYIFLSLALSSVILFTSTACGSTGKDTDMTENSTPETVINNNTKEISSMERFKDIITELPPEGYDSKKDGIIYPEFKKYTYYSRTAERDTPVNVLLPADYTEDRKYPVLYILHGFFDSEDWMARDEVAIPQILANLQQNDEAKDMIVVLPYIYCSKEQQTVSGMDLKNCLAYDNFINDMMTDLMPFINSTFSVAEGRENTAITGFSMGGRESLFISCKHPEIFGYIGAVCPAPGLVEIPGSPMHPGQISPGDMKFPDDNKPFVLMISSSKADNVVTDAPDSYRKIFTDNGEPFLSHVLTSTYHDHTSVKPHLYNFLRTVFR